MILLNLLSFSTFASMLMAEELHDENENASTTSILVAQSSTASSVPLSSNVSYQTLGVPSVNTSTTPQSPLLPPPFQFPFPTPPQQQLYPSNYNGPNRSNKNNQRFNRNQNQYSSSGGCQICGKTNHLAYSCYHRQMLAFRPMGRSGNNGNYDYSGNGDYYQSQGFAPQGFSQGFAPQGFSQGFAPQGFAQGFGSQGFSQGSAHQSVTQGSAPPNFAYPRFASQGNYASLGTFGGQSSHDGSQSNNPQALFVSPNTMGHYIPQGPPPVDYALGLQPTQGCNTTASSSRAPSSPWFFDSSATSHVTNDASQIQISCGGTGANSVTVGNGQAIPVAHSGRSHTPSPASRELSQGTLSPASFF